MTRNTRLFIWGLIKLALSSIVIAVMIIIITDHKDNWTTWVLLIYYSYLWFSGYFNVNKSLQP